MLTSSRSALVEQSSKFDGSKQGILSEGEETWYKCPSHFVKKEMILFNAKGADLK